MHVEPENVVPGGCIEPSFLMRLAPPSPVSVFGENFIRGPEEETQIVKGSDGALLITGNSGFAANCYQNSGH